MPTPESEVHGCRLRALWLCRKRWFWAYGWRVADAGIGRSASLSSRADPIAVASPLDCCCLMLSRRPKPYMDNADALEELAEEESKDMLSTFPCPPSDSHAAPPLATVVRMSRWEELLCCIVLFFVPGAALWVPVTTLALIGAFRLLLTHTVVFRTRTCARRSSVVCR